MDSKTMILQYLETLEALGAAESTKLLVPMEFTSLLRPFVDHGERASREASESPQAPGDGRREPRREAA